MMFHKHARGKLLICSLRRGFDDAVGALGLVGLWNRRAITYHRPTSTFNHAVNLYLSCTCLARRIASRYHVGPFGPVWASQDARGRFVFATFLSTHPVVDLVNHRCLQHVEASRQETMPTRALRVAPLARAGAGGRACGGFVRRPIARVSRMHPGSFVCSFVRSFVRAILQELHMPNER